jgi:hypothetical protein
LNNFLLSDKTVSRKNIKGQLSKLKLGKASDIKAAINESFQISGFRCQSQESGEHFGIGFFVVETVEQNSVARFCLLQAYQNGKNRPIDYKLNQMFIKYTKWP